MRHRADIGDHRLGSAPVARVPAVTPLHRVLVVAEMLTQLGLQASFEHPLGEIAEQPA
jgi:hypothetical protein